MIIAPSNADSKLQQDIDYLIIKAIEEDKIFSDITSDITIKDNKNSNFQLRACNNMVVCGTFIIDNIVAIVKNNHLSDKFANTEISYQIIIKDGDTAKKNDVIIKGFGNAKLIFAIERILLNFIQHLSGIATQTNNFVTKLNNKNIKIIDTRKTIPSLRRLQKYAVTIGGGDNHRFDLSEMLLIKDNHIACIDDIESVFKEARCTNKKIEIECDNIEQLNNFVALKPDIIMLDNMSIDDIKQSSSIIRNFNKNNNCNITIEVSGGINIDNINNYSKLDIDFISIGFITHSVMACDISLDIIF